ncbi:hypothetical protein VPH35_033369 [Triticum aestivum]
MAAHQGRHRARGGGVDALAVSVSTCALLLAVEIVPSFEPSTYHSGCTAWTPRRTFREIHIRMLTSFAASFVCTSSCVGDGSSSSTPRWIRHASAQPSCPKTLADKR